MGKNNRPLSNDMRINVKLPKELHVKAMTKAQSEGKTLSEIVRSMLEAYVGS